MKRRHQSRLEMLLMMSEMERRLLVKSLFLSFYIFAVVRLSSFRGIRRLVRTDSLNLSASRDLCLTAERAVRRAWRLSPARGRCLEMALTLMIVLHDEGVRAHLRLGVHPNIENFAAHAWVEVPQIGFVASFGDDWLPVATLV